MHDTTKPTTNRRRHLLARIAIPALIVTVATLGLATPALAHPVLHIAANPTTVLAGRTTTITISGTSNGNYTGARIDVTAGSGTGGTTGSLPAFSNITSFGGGIVSATEVGSVDRLALPTLTNGQAFSYTLTVTIGAAVNPGTFKANAQFFKSDNTTDGLTTGPVITVVAPTDFATSVTSAGAPSALDLSHIDLEATVTNLGPGDASDATIVTTISMSTGMTLTHIDGFGNFHCTIGTGNLVGSCYLATIPLPAGGAGAISSLYTIGALTTGTVTLTTTVVSTRDSNISNDSASINCTILLGLVTSCA